MVKLIFFSLSLDQLDQNETHEHSRLNETSTQKREEPLSDCNWYLLRVLLIDCFVRYGIVIHLIEFEIHILKEIRSFHVIGFFSIPTQYTNKATRDSAQ